MESLMDIIESCYYRPSLILPLVEKSSLLINRVVAHVCVLDVFRIVFNDIVLIFVNPFREELLVILVIIIVN